MENEVSRLRGRPKDLEKRAAIVTSARKLFFDHGLAAVRIDQVALEAGVSKMTVYANFVDKSALFEAVVAEESERLDGALSRLQVEGDTIELLLTKLGMELMAFLLSPEVMRLDRLLGAEINNHPDLGQNFYKAGPDRMWRKVAEVLSAAGSRDELHVQNPKQAAEDLLALWLGMLPFQHRFNEGPAIGQQTISDRVTHGVSIFLNTYGPASDSVRQYHSY